MINIRASCSTLPMMRTASESYAASKTWAPVPGRRATTTYNFSDDIGKSIWTDGTDTYFSCGDYQYKLNRETGKWEKMTWTGLKRFDGKFVWTDGTNIYYSSGGNQYKLKAGTTEWEVMTWTGTSNNINGYCVWTDGENIYYSYSTLQYKLKAGTMEWEKITWTGPWTGSANINGYRIWTDGESIYYSYSTVQYKLKAGTTEWEAMTWTGLTDFNSEFVWSDGTYVYATKGTYGNNPAYKLTPGTTEWQEFEWNKLGEYGYSISRNNIWSDGTNIYATMKRNSSELDTYYVDTLILLPTTTKIYAYRDDGVSPLWTEVGAIST